MRYVTTVPQQALFFLNNPFVTEQARHLAARKEVAEAPNPTEKIRTLYRLVFARAPEQWEIDAGVQFVSREDAPAESRPVSPWQYGTGEYNGESGQVSFTPFQVFVGDRWQGDAALPAAGSGTAVLRATGGQPGEKLHQAVIRRWVSPLSGKINIEGVLRHGQPAVPYGDGVRGRIASSRHGELASWWVNGSSAETKLNGIVVEKGDAIDFIVDARLDPEGNGFGWAPIIRSGERAWNARTDFAGPEPEPPGLWARYAQVLFETNEFAFVD
jgi:hypothetical protein